MSDARKPRGRALGLPFPGVTGPHNAITDVPGVLVGFHTVRQDAAPGRPSLQTGVTAILPRGRALPLRPVWAGTFDLNGNGEMTGTHWIADSGQFAGPICITNTHSVGIVHHAAVRWMIETYGATFDGPHFWAMPVVAETYDGVLNDINALGVTEAHARAALDGASDGPVAEGNVGGGAGMIAYEFKAGTGTASRRLRAGGLDGAVGVLVQANHGLRGQLSVLGVPVGRHLQADLLKFRESGSIIVIVATDLPVLPHQLSRIARRAALGVGRGGAIGGNSSGDIFLAFTTANGAALDDAAASPRQLLALPDEALDAIYTATVDATEEAVINALLAALDVPTFRPPGRVARAIDHDALIDLMRRHGRIGERA